ncbi:5-azacytidine resistance protein azr1 [Aspergillus sp. HF37]|nr:5-azacytidine resistance protein azr1 [Aspergillus sp. HF37]
MIPLNLPCRACSLSCSSLQTAPRNRLVSLTSQSARQSLCSLRGLPRRSFFHSTPRLSSSPRISYKVAVSSSGKGRRFHPIKNAYDFDPSLHDALGVLPDNEDPIARRNARPDSGEDAFFVSKVGRDNTQANGDAIAFAVADGVGGWTESRVDPADFSHALCSYMASSALSWSSPAEKLRAKQLLQMGYDRVVEDNSVRAGGSTASVGVGLDDGRIELANLGDSGSVLLRLAAVHHYSAPQTHGFNTPYQLSIIPPRMRSQASLFGGAFLEDFPRDAAVTNVNMQHGDVLVLATDGVFDNLNNQDILRAVTDRMVVTGAWTAMPNVGIGVSDSLTSLTGPDGLAPLISKSAPARSVTEDKAPTLQAVLAASLASDAKMASLDYRRDGPFAKEAQRYYPLDYYRGGKVDDIAVLVVVAVEEGRDG